MVHIFDRSWLRQREEACLSTGDSQLCSDGHREQSSTDHQMLPFLKHLPVGNKDDDDSRDYAKLVEGFNIRNDVQRLDNG